MKSLPSTPVFALLAGAAVWGVVWYPFRLLAAGGLDGIWSTIFTYGIAFVIGATLFRRDLATLWPLPPLAILMGAAIGWSNLAYVVAVLNGEVMRVLFLFYLAPLWTVPLAWMILGERLDGAGAFVMALAMIGAVTMLWRADLGAPWPASFSEWLGVLAGVFFALGNVLVRRLESMTDAAKSIVIWAGVTIAGLAHVAWSPSDFSAAVHAATGNALLVVIIGASLVAMSYSIQYGLARVAANRAIVILLFELVVAAVAAYFLAGETMRAQDWIGGGFIVAACLASSRMGTRLLPSTASADAPR